MSNKCRGTRLAGDLPFKWETDFDFDWWEAGQEIRGLTHERNIMIVIPGLNRQKSRHLWRIIMTRLTWPMFITRIREDPEARNCLPQELTTITRPHHVDARPRRLFCDLSRKRKAGL